MNTTRFRLAALALGVAALLLVAATLALRDVAWPDALVHAVAPIAKIDRRAQVPADAAVAGADDDSALDAPVGSLLAQAGPLEHAPLLAAAAAPVVSAPSVRAERAGTDFPTDCPPLLQQQFNRLQTGEPQSLCQFRGKVLLVVNTASYCAYTGQYEGLEALYRKYRARGLVVVGFPSNDFGGQEPGTNHEIAQFCRLTYGVEFPMFEKSSVTSVASNPLFAQLAASTGVAPQWNFYKYLVDRHGRPVAGFDSKTTPQDHKLVRLVEGLLAERVPEG
ncbi:MAG TPA: glutathione peroxidase [Casimicrobiaceae bacterium]|jgi:glutathione peroxidase|nr:glutathione peroxidase [Casimicrobiaceae bacterium]